MFSEELVYTPTSRIWGMVQNLLGMPEPRSHTARLAVTFGCSFLDVAEMVADELSHTFTAAAAFS